MDKQTKQQISHIKPIRKINKRFYITISTCIVIIIMVVVGWTGLTRAGYLENWLKIEFLSPELESETQPEPEPEPQPQPQPDPEPEPEPQPQPQPDPEPEPEPQPQPQPDPELEHKAGPECLEECEEHKKNKTSEFYETVNCTTLCMPTPVRKPVIYLYPEQVQEVEIKIDYDFEFLVTYPEYQDGWRVSAYPDGTIINLADGQEYSYLFWEGVLDDSVNYNLSAGFVVKGEDTAEFLQEQLSFLGLQPREYNEFIVYWLPQMIDNKYNLIHFATQQEYGDKVKLDINPEPDSILRVFMVFKVLDERVDIMPQPLELFERQGFTVVEWGGTQIK